MGGKTQFPYSSNRYETRLHHDTICKHPISLRQRCHQSSYTDMVADISSGKNTQIGRPGPSVTPCNSEFKPPLVKPIKRPLTSFYAAV